MSVQITEKDFKEYVVVQQSGKYNMFDPKARKKTNLSKDQWEKIVKHYKTFYDAWIDKENNLNEG